MNEFEKRKIFISWSKRPSDRIASALKSLLLHMFDNIEPFVSKETIEFGTLSIPEIFRALSGSDFGFLIVTTQNQAEPWLNFEAGALAKSIAEDGDTRVVPLLIDFDSVGQLSPGPIANLQAQVVTENDLLQVVQMMARVLSVDAATVAARWTAAWAAFDEELQDVRKELAQPQEGPVHDRTVEDMLEELLALSRGQARRQIAPTAEPVNLAKHRTSADDARLIHAFSSTLIDLGFPQFSTFMGTSGLEVRFDEELHNDQVDLLKDAIAEEFGRRKLRVEVILPKNGLVLRTLPSGRVRTVEADPQS